MNAALRMGEDGTSERVAGFTLVEASLTLHAEVAVFDPVEHEQGPLDPADLAEREIQPVLLPARAELAKNGGRFQGPVPDTCGKPQHVTPVLSDDFLVYWPSHHRRRRRPLLRRAEMPQAALREIAKPRRECQAQQVKEREDMI